MWRVEDIDRVRFVDGMTEAAMRDLAWLGLDWDEGPDRRGPHAPYLQSERTARYESALDSLACAGRVFPCTLSRKDLEDIASAPHGAAVSPAYPRSLRPTALDSGWLEDVRAGRGNAAAIRFAVDEGETTFEDRVFGVVRERAAETVGDFVVRRRDGVFAYQLAVVVDDLEMEVGEVVRGADLLESTARQIQLIEALGGVRPVYSHVPLVKNARGEKLSKRDAALTLRSLRDAGVAAESVVGFLAWSLGLLPRAEACTARELLSTFSWSAIARDEFTLPADVVAQLRRL